MSCRPESQPRIEGMSTEQYVSSDKTLAEWLMVKPNEPVQVTILFTDIVSSTKLCNGIGDKRWMELLLRHFRQGLKLVAKHDGYKIKFIGDSFMVAFRSPVSALRFATAFHKNSGHSYIQIRACIHTGSGRVIDNDVFGRMVNYAARILGWKKDSGVVLSSDAHAQLMAEYGEQRANEVFVQFSGQDLKDFPNQTIYALNPAAWWVARIREAIPDLREIQSADGMGGCMLRQATARDIDWIADLEIKTYGRSIAVPGRILHAWYDANPHGFTILQTEDGELVGHINILPLKPSGVELLLKGRESEQAITPDMIYSPVEQHLMESFYVECIIVKTTYKDVKPKALSCIMGSLKSLMSRICDSPNSKNVYGLGGTKGGERLMQQLGFRLISQGYERGDGFPLYVASYADIQTNIATILEGAPRPDAA